MEKLSSAWYNQKSYIFEIVNSSTNYYNYLCLYMSTLDMKNIYWSLQLYDYSETIDKKMYIMRSNRTCYLIRDVIIFKIAIVKRLIWRFTFSFEAVG